MLPGLGQLVIIKCILFFFSSLSRNNPTSLLFLQGRFEILSLSGSFMPTENGGHKSRSGGMSVSLAGPDGRVLGGGLAGLLVASGPVQVKPYSTKDSKK